MASRLVAAAAVCGEGSAAAALLGELRGRVGEAAADWAEEVAAEAVEEEGGEDECEEEEEVEASLLPNYPPQLSVTPARCP